MTAQVNIAHYNINIVSYLFVCIEQVMNLNGSRDISLLLNFFIVIMKVEK
jgi:hypothetical protein